MAIIRGFLHVFATIKLDMLDNFADDVEDAILDQRDFYINQLDEEATKLTEDEKEIFWDYKIDRLDELRTEYPNTLRASVLISCYSTLEKTLVDLHKFLRKSGISSIRKLDDESLKGKSTIEKVASCIEADLGISTPFTLDSWKRIITYKKIRNKVVHELGKVSSTSPLATEIKNLPYVSINNLNEIEFDSDFSKHVIKDIRKFLLSIFEKIQEVNILHK
ncbi:hypothetical protein ACEU2D_19915 [Brevibacillus laterosporus]|uniref:hypothetical protein n=1 Tax=Brevibacillus laterosporus TaxID=1465 RepID=UPI0035A5D263